MLLGLEIIHAGIAAEVDELSFEENEVRGIHILLRHHRALGVAHDDQILVNRHGEEPRRTLLELPDALLAAQSDLVALPSDALIGLHGLGHAGTTFVLDFDDFVCGIGDLLRRSNVLVCLLPAFLAAHVNTLSIGFEVELPVHFLAIHGALRVAVEGLDGFVLCEKHACHSAQHEQETHGHLQLSLGAHGTSGP